MAAIGSSASNQDTARRETRLPAAELVLIATVLAAVNVYTVWFVAAEHTLYRADQLAYWTYSSRLAADLHQAPWSALQAVAWSVAHADLNLLPSLPIAAVLMVIGDSRLAYLLAIINLYGLAVLVILLLAVRWLTPIDRTTRSWLTVCAASGAVLLLPTLWRPIFIGYLGLGGVALGIVILAVWLGPVSREPSWKILLLLGFLTAFLALFRRWFVLWGVAFCGVLLVDAVWRLVERRERSWRALLAAARVPVAVGGAAVVTTMVLAGPITLQRLASGYREEFAAFVHHGGTAGRLAAVVREFGMMPLGLVLVAAVTLARRPATRRAAVLVPLHMVLTWLLMIRIQDHSPHHWYLYLAAALLLLALGLAQVVGRIEQRRLRVGSAAAILAVGALTTGVVYLPALGSTGDAVGPLIPRPRVRPAQRADLDEVRRLLGFLDELLEAWPAPIYVLGNSGTLSEQTLAFANRSLGTRYRSPSMILRAAHIDRRDGFPRGLLEAGYVVVPRPAQYNMRPEDQQVILIPTASFLSGDGIARAFERLAEEFELEDGVQVSVFVRRSTITQSQVDQLSGQLRERYPDRPDIWRPYGAESEE
jgi:hypothetical protein